MATIVRARRQGLTLFHVEQQFVHITPLVSRETRSRLVDLVDAVSAEAQNQNLIATSTLSTIWERHIADSLQLLPEVVEGPLVDIGAGAGFPGLVLAIASACPVHLVEPRRKRATFLRETADRLGLRNVAVHQCKVQDVRLTNIATVTARAVAALDILFAIAEHLATPTTTWIIPKGRNAVNELAVARRTWQGEFRLVPSRTEPEASIVIARLVRRI